MVGMVVLGGAEIVDDRIYSKEELATIVSAPVLSEIPPLTTTAEEGQLLRAEWLQRGTLSLIGVLIPAGFATTYLFG
jgi:hypothetical protein